MTWLMWHNVSVYLCKIRVLIYRSSSGWLWANYISVTIQYKLKGRFSKVRVVCERKVKGVNTSHLEALSSLPMLQTPGGSRRTSLFPRFYEPVPHALEIGPSWWASLGTWSNLRFGLLWVGDEARRLDSEHSKTVLDLGCLDPAICIPYRIPC